MTIDEDTGEDVVCPICGAAEYWDCGHLVGSFDRSFCECQGGAIYDRQGEFSSIIEGVFLSHLQNGSEPGLKYDAFPELWAAAKSNYEPDDDYVDLDGDILQRLLIEVLEHAGAYEEPGSLMDPGGPGMTSSMSLLFAEYPSEVVARALHRVSVALKNELPDAPPYVDHILLWDRDPVVRTSDGRWFIDGQNGWWQTEITEITFSMNPGWFYDTKDPEGWKKCLHSESDIAEVERLVAKKDADR